MGLSIPPIKSGGQDFDPIPEGTYTAVLYGVVDAGHQDATDFNGVPEVQHQVHFLFELPDERLPDGRPRGSSKKFKLSMHEKAGLRKAVHALLGRQLSDAEAVQINLLDLIGRGCNVSIIEKDRRDGKGTYSRIESFSPLKRSEQVPKPENQPVAYEIEDGEPPEILPEWLRSEIRSSHEHRQRGPARNTEGTEGKPRRDPEPAGTSAGGRGDDIPF